MQEIIDSLPPATTEPAGRSSGTHNKNKSTLVSTIGTTVSDNVLLIKVNAVDELRQRLNAIPVSLSSHEEVYEYLKKQDLSAFLGLQRNPFNCVVHPDTNPSATIVVAKATGHHLYKCHSASCNFVGTIIDCVQQLTGFPFDRAMTFLRQVYQITYKENPWQMTQREILDNNVRTVLSPILALDHPEIRAEYGHRGSPVNGKIKYNVLRH